MTKTINATWSAVVAIMLFCHQSPAQTVDMINGQWKNNEDSNLQLEFYKDNDGLYYGKTLKDSKKDGKELKKGSLLFKKLKFDGASKTFKGVMSPPGATMEINATLSFEGSDKIKVVAKKFVMTKTLLLTRIK